VIHVSVQHHKIIRIFVLFTLIIVFYNLLHHLAEYTYSVPVVYPQDLSVWMALVLV
jgi:hypothetical protein